MNAPKEITMLWLALGFIAVFGSLTTKRVVNLEKAASQPVRTILPVVIIEPATGESPESRRLRFQACVQRLDPDSPTLHEAIVRCAEVGR